MATQRFSLQGLPQRISPKKTLATPSIRVIGYLLVSLTFSISGLGISGCALLTGAKTEDEIAELALKKLLTVPVPPDLVREAVVSKGLEVIRVDGVGLVNQLVGSGGAPQPSALRDSLVDEMMLRNVPQPSLILEGNDTALVEVRGIIPPGARSGDPIDLIVVAPENSEVSDLHGGYLLATRMRHQQIIHNSVRKSEVLATGSGTMLTRADYEPGTDNSLQITSKIIAGGRVRSDRDLGLILRPKFQHVKMSSALAEAINRRFFFFDGTTRRGIAKPIKDDLIEIDVHPRYRQNVVRMMAVLGAIGMKPESTQTQFRLIELGQQLSNPSTAADAAIQLEAIGQNGVPTLLEAIQSPNPELRFYAAETLAYLDRIEAIAPLEEAARSEAAFRYPALEALQGIDQSSAVAALQRLMDQPSLETRYGAFRALRRRADGNRVLAAEKIEDQFTLYQVPSAASATVVVSIRESAEIVLLGNVRNLEFDSHLFGPGGLTIKSDSSHSGQIRISRFLPGTAGDQFIVVSASIPEMIRGIVSVGGSYGDVVAILRGAKDKGFLKDQLSIDPLPKAQRTYYRDQDSDAGGEEL